MNALRNEARSGTHTGDCSCTKSKVFTGCLVVFLSVLVVLSLQANELNQQFSTVGTIETSSSLEDALNSEEEDTGSGPLALHGGHFLVWSTRNCVGDDPGFLADQTSVDQHCEDHGIESHKYKDETGKVWGCVNCHKRKWWHNEANGVPSGGGGIDIRVINPDDAPHGHRHDRGHDHGDRVTSRVPWSQTPSEKGFFTIFDDIRDMLSSATKFPTLATFVPLPLNSQPEFDFKVEFGG